MTTFKKIKIGDDFIYKDLVYIKLNDKVGFNDRYGSFVIHSNEKVKLISKNNSIISIIETLTPIVVFIFVFTVWCLDKCR